MRLIDVDALIKEHCNGCSQDIREGCKTDPVCATLMWFEDAPTIDAVPVVRCKDCKHCDFHEFQHAVCWRRNNMVFKDGFCSYGERKEADGNG